MDGVVYFDGHCNLCNAAVDYLVRHDRAAQLRFAPLSGETARARLPAEFIGEHPGTVVYVEGGRTYVRSTAALKILGRLGGAHRILLLGYLVPRALRDRIYKFIARHRYRWFGRRETCRLPSADEQVRFLP